MFVINPKYEYRNSKQIQNIKILNFEFYLLEFVSSFGFRASNLFIAYLLHILLAQLRRTRLFPFVKWGFYNPCIIHIIPNLNLELLSCFGVLRLYKAQTNVFLCGRTKRTAGNLTNHLVSFKNRIAMSGNAAVYHLKSNQLSVNASCLLV